MPYEINLNILKTVMFLINKCPLNTPCVKNKTIQLSAYEWNDEDSELEWYNFTIYPMSLDGENLLTENVAPLAILNFSATDAEQHYYDLPHSGMFSMWVAVQDYAGNVARARGLVLYDNTSGVTTTSNPLYVANAASETDYQWIHSTDQPLVFNWTGHFENKEHKERGLLNEVKPVPDGWGMDDTTDNRTINAIQHTNGITAFKFAYEKDNDGGQPKEPRHWTDRPDLTAHASVPVPTLDDGESVVWWVEAEDAFHRKNKSRAVLHVDSTPPYVARAEFVKNVDSGKRSMPFASRYNVLFYATILCLGGFGRS